MSEPRKRSGRKRTPRPEAGKRRSEPPSSNGSRLVVGLGASAGGLEAFQKFFAHMAPDRGLAFIVAQHLDPRHETLMPELLRKGTSMAVVQASDATLVEPNHVYVMPSNASLTIEGGRLRVQKPPDPVSRHAAIDRLFSSLAEDQGENAVCILFSGSGSDGTLGLRAVKEHGGMTMAQSPESAQHDSMVRSAIATGLVDHVLPAERLPERLVQYADHLRKLKRKPEVLLEEASDQLARICELVRRKTGHDFSRYKRPTLIRRIQRRMQVVQAATVVSYLTQLREDASEAELLFRDLLIGVTHFFRDPEAFEAMAAEVVPRLLAEADGDVRVWTPGCSTGEEAYSVAILLREAMARMHSRPKVQIFAGDIDAEALAFARAASYPEGIAAHVTPERLERFFVRNGHRYQVAKDVREMCLFSRHSAIRDPPFSRVGLIVCRNLLIYLEGDLQRHLASLFHYALRPGGYLFLGPSESFGGSPELFRTVDKKHRIFQRIETLSRPSLALPIPDLRRTREAPLRASRTPAQPGAGQDRVRVLEGILLENYAPAWVIVNSQGEAVYFSPRTGRYLEAPAGHASLDLVSMARKGLRLDLRTAIHKAMKTRETVIHEDILVASDGELQRINLVVRPVTELTGDHGLYMVVFQELGPSKSRQQAEQEGAVLRGGDPLSEQLESELRATKARLQASLEEVETANEELKSSNEELQSSNEELQTSKEELQSVNEELETINLELSQKVEELNRAHNDLHHLLQSTHIPTLFLDADLRIKWFTESANRLYRLIESDAGRPIGDITPRFPEEGLLAEMQRVLRTGDPSERRVRLLDGGASYLLRTLPYRRGDGRIDGVVLAFLDVTQLDRALEQRAQLAAIVESSPEAIVGRSFDGTIRIWNQGAANLFGYSDSEALGAPLTLIVPPEYRAEIAHAHDQLRRGEPVAPFETVRQAKDGRRISVLATLSPIKDAGGNVIAAASVFHDVSELKRSQEALREDARKKDEFLALLSHELRNPLAPLRNCVNILQGTASDEPQRKLIEMMDRQVAHFTHLVDELLDASRISSGKIQLHRRTLDLEELVRRAAEDYRSILEAKGVSLAVELTGHATWIDGDPDRLSQVVSNLLSNSAKFTERGGSVRVAVGRDFSENAAVVNVRDSGSGMDAETQEHLFQPFRQDDRMRFRAGGGLGLGLALVKSLIELHGGSVVGTSEGAGLGSEFSFRLPLQMERQEVRGRSALPPRAAGPQPARRILVVEDNRDAAESTRIMLELDGHTVDVAADGETALAKARQFRPDVVICDISLPGRLNGYGVATALRRAPDTQDVRLIALTGHGRGEDQEKARDAGFDIHVSKPADPLALKAILARMPPYS